jgi:hypothetical protein
MRRAPDPGMTRALAGSGAPFLLAEFLPTAVSHDGTFALACKAHSSSTRAAKPSWVRALGDLPFEIDAQSRWAIAASPSHPVG